MDKYNIPDRLKLHEAAKILRVSVQTLRNWDKTKKLVAFRNKISGHRYYTREQICSILDEGDPINDR